MPDNPDPDNADQQQMSNESTYVDFQELIDRAALKESQAPPEKPSLKERLIHKLNRIVHEKAYKAYKVLNEKVGKNDNVTLGKLDRHGDAVMKIDSEDGSPKEINIHFGKDGAIAKDRDDQGKVDELLYAEVPRGIEPTEGPSR